MNENMLMTESTKSMPSSMMNTVKGSAEGFIEKVKMSKDRLFEIGLYAGAGFLSGFLLKKYSTYVVVFVLILVGLGVMQQMEVINCTINWDKVSEVFGIQVAQTVIPDNILTTIWEWVRLNMVISVSYLVGLFIGLKLG